MSLLRRLEGGTTSPSPGPVTIKEDAPGKPSRREGYEPLKLKVHQRLVEELGEVKSTALSPAGAMDSSRVAAKVEVILDELAGAENVFLPRVDRQRLVADVLAEAIGYGPIQPLIDDDSISEIMVNGPRRVYVERGGKLELTGVAFRDDDHVLHVIEKIVSPLGRRIDESNPMVDARLPDGSRVNAVIPPLALNGPVLTIRKFSRDPLTAENLISFGSVSEEMVRFLEACVRARLNIVVSGGTGSGKTTMLNILSAYIPVDERIITIEDAAELQLRQEHVITMETRPSNVEGKGAITIRDLVRNSLRMRPDRIVVGEVRSGEALDMLQAMNTGHDGSLTTGHANSPRDMLARLETMVLMAGMDLPVKAIREQIAAAVDLVVHQSRFRDGTRKVTHITEVQGMEGDIIVLQDIFVYEQAGVDESGKVKGRFRATGLRPKFMKKIEEAGITLPNHVLFPNASDLFRKRG